MTSEYDGIVEYGQDRIVTYRAFPADHESPFGPCTLRIRTFGGRLPVDKDITYRQAVCRTLEGNGQTVMEVVVTDEPFVHNGPHYYVHGFHDARAEVPS